MSKFGLTVIVFALPFLLRAQVIARLDVHLSHPASGMILPAETNLDRITSLQANELSLLHVRGGKSIPVPFQVTQSAGSRYLHWIIEPASQDGVRFEYELIRKKVTPPADKMKVVRENGKATVQNDVRKFLRYQFGKCESPAGVDSSYGRSGFIHPLWSPKGHELTRIQPADHYHHYGIWNPWTHVLYKGDTLDFWNLNKKEGTVRFAEFLHTTDGPVFAEYKVLHEHLVLKNRMNEVALNEIQTVRVYEPLGRDYYIADISIDLSCATDAAFLILEYRYGGLGWRTTEKWDNKNSEVLTSESKTRKDADGSTARWCLVQGAIDSDHAGALMMSHRTNYNHPEPLRIWPENQYDRGDMFVNFSPTKNKDWKLLPGETYSLKYRFVVFDGRFGKERSEVTWQHYANPPKVIVKKP